MFLEKPAVSFLAYVKHVIALVFGDLCPAGFRLRLQGKVLKHPLLRRVYKP
jgi:hypothetical protein